MLTSKSSAAGSQYINDELCMVYHSLSYKP